MQNPKFIISKKKVLEQYEIVSSIADIVSYSSKTNPVVTKILEENTNCMISIHLSNELKNVKDFSRVLFLAQGWNSEDILIMIKQGIFNFVVDNEKDLNELIKVLEKNKFDKINLFLRIKLKESTIKTERYFVFGMNSEIVNKKLNEIRNNENLVGKIGNLGIHFHRKSQNLAEWNLQYEFENMIDKENLELIDIVNIGGGLPSVYANTNVDAIPGILEKIKEFRRWLNENKIKLMLEPGRFIAAPSGKLITRILRIYENNIVVNASVYNSDLDALVVPVKLLIDGELKKEDENAKPFVVKGITPCSMDLFRYRVYLRNVREGGELIFLNAGAYNFSSDFCDLEKIETEIVD